MFADLPPSSSVSLVCCAGERGLDLPPDRGRAREGDFVYVFFTDEGRARVAIAREDGDDAWRQLGLLADLGEQQRGQRRRLRRLEDRDVPARERRRELPRRHQQREVPRHDLPDDPERPYLSGVDAVAELVGPAGVVEEVRGGERDVDVAGLSERLASVERLDDRELARALLDQPRDPEQVLGALEVSERRPLRLRGPGALDGCGHVVRAPVCHLRYRLLRGGVDRRNVPAIRWVLEVTVDEQAVPLAQPDVVGRLGCRGVVPDDAGSGLDAHSLEKSSARP